MAEKKIIFIGKSGAGKTTLLNRLQYGVAEAKKTQAANFLGCFIDTPGEYLENRPLYRALISLACEADLIALVQEAQSEENWFPQAFALCFAKPVIGIITKCDHAAADLARAGTFLRGAGAEAVYETSALTGEGLDRLMEALS